MNLGEVASLNNTFAVAVGNPPYQVEVATIASKAEEKTVMNVFHLHHETGIEIADKTTMIYPGARWINRSGKGLKAFGESLVNSPRLSKVIYWNDSSDVFQGVEIGDGISVVFTSSNPEENWILDFRWAKKNVFDASQIQKPGKGLIVLDPRQRKVVEKVWRKAESLSQVSLAQKVTPQKTFSLESNFVELNPELVVRGEEPRPEEGEWVRAFLNDVAGKAGRARWYWLPREQIRTRVELIDQWKVIVSSMNCVGARGTGHSPLAEILPPGSVFGRSRLCLNHFATEFEARLFFILVSSDFYRFLYGALGDSQTLLAHLAPDIGDYGPSSPFAHVKDKREAHRALSDFYGLSEVERNFMTEWCEAHLAPFAKSEVSVGS